MVMLVMLLITHEFDHGDDSDAWTFCLMDDRQDQTVQDKFKNERSKRRRSQLSLGRIQWEFQYILVFVWNLGTQKPYSLDNHIFSHIFSYVNIASISYDIKKYVEGGPDRKAPEPGGSIEYQFVYLNVVTVCLNDLDSVSLNGWAKENLPGGSLKYLFVYLKIRILKCSYCIIKIKTT